MNNTSSPPLRKKVSLKPFNTFQLDVIAAYWSEIKRPDDLKSLMETEVFQSRPHYILGGGSNVLFSENYSGLIIKNAIPGISLISEDRNHATLQVGAGIVWDDLVHYALNHNLGGLENLSMIPGLCGAAPIQNIGAYGIELKSTFVSLDAIHLKTGKTESFDKAMCRFGYRDSIFKQQQKGRYLITHIVLKLDKEPQIRVDYGDLKQTLESEGITHPTIQDISRAVRKIRSSKLPDPNITGNAGSFFKNPVIARDRFEALRDRYPQIPGYPTDSSSVKIPAAWLIEQCGFKGKRDGDAGVHERHALILVNYGNATGQQLLRLADAIRNEVKNRFGVTLEPEVNIVM